MTKNDSDFKAILFDLGGVVIEIDFDLAFQYWAKFSRLSHEEIQSRFVMDEAYEKHERGEISADEYFEHLRNTLQLTASNLEIERGWNAIYVGVIDETLNYIYSIHKTIPCFAFTNTNKSHQVFWSEKYSVIVDKFRHIFVSSTLGVRKPELAAFELIADAIGVKPSQILFFDDSQENIVGARAAGFMAIQVSSPADVIHGLTDTGALAT